MKIYSQMSSQNYKSRQFNHENNSADQFKYF